MHRLKGHYYKYEDIDRSNPKKFSVIANGFSVEMIEFQQPSDAHDEQQQQQQQLLPSPTSSLGSKTAAAAPLTQPVKTSTNIFASIKASIKTETAHDIETVAAPPLPKKRKIAAASGATSSNGSNGRSPINCLLYTSPSPRD